MKKIMSPYALKIVTLTLALSVITVIPTIVMANEPDDLSLEGKSFPGSIRAKGLIGLVSVKGTLSFNEGSLVWTVDSTNDTAPYKLEEFDGSVKFTSRMPTQDGEYVDWSGVYDGKTLSDVTALWTRGKGDFIHDLLLPDVVTLVFTPE